MKLGKWIVVLLAANLGVMLLVLTRRPAPVTAAPAVRRIPDPGLTPPAPKPRLVQVTNRFDWSLLESPDYRDYVLRLRAVGCPEETIRDLIIADLEKAQAPRLQALRPRKADLKYWDSEEEQLANEVDHAAVARQEKALEEEKRQYVRQLVGVDLYQERRKVKGQTDYYDRRLGFLPEEKRDQVRQVLEQYQELDAAVRHPAEGEPLTPEERARLIQSRAERESALAQVLSPEERQQLDLWASPSADQVRRSLYGMSASETEFHKIYQLKTNFEATWDPLKFDRQNPEVQPQYEKASRELEASIQAALGDRYPLYQRGQDQDFHDLNALVTQAQLPREKAVEIYEMKRTLQEQRQIVQTADNLTPEKRNDILGMLQDETERAVRQTLGERVFRQYRRNAAWLKP